jgi:toxin FitB
MQYLIDTNIISGIMNRSPDHRLFSWFTSLQEFNFSAITVEEIYYGLSRRKLPNKLTWFKQFSSDKAKILKITSSIAQWSGEKRGELAAEGIAVTMADSLIAATAHEYGLILATRNVKDFQHFGIAVINPFLID